MMKLSVFLKLSLVVLSFSAWAEKDDVNNIERQEWKEKIGKSNVVVHNYIGDVRIRFGGYENELEGIGMVQHNEKKGKLTIREYFKKDDNTYNIEVVRQEGKEEIELLQGDKARVDLTLYIPLGRETFVKTKDGLIEAKGMKDKVTLQSEGGKITGRKNKKTISAKTTSGEIRFNLLDHGIDKGQVFESTTGDINIWISAGAKHNAELLTSSDITTDFSVDITDLPGQEPSKKAVAKINRGGSLIRLSSKRGSVALRKYPEKSN